MLSMQAAVVESWRGVLFVIIINHRSFLKRTPKDKYDPDTGQAFRRPINEYKLPQF